MLQADPEDTPCMLQDFPIPEAKLIQLAQELFAKEAGVTDDSLLSDDFRRASATLFMCSSCVWPHASA